MIPKPDHIRVMERPRTREENPSPAAGNAHTPPKNQNLPQGGQVGRWVGGSHVLGHETKTGHDTPPRRLSRKERKEAVVAWMVASGITNRTAVFAGCPESNRSASLHHAAINILRRAGLVERVWREYVFCVEDEEARAWLNKWKSDKHA